MPHRVAVRVDKVVKKAKKASAVQSSAEATGSATPTSSAKPTATATVEVSDGHKSSDGYEPSYGFTFRAAEFNQWKSCPPTFRMEFAGEECLLTATAVLGMLGSMVPEKSHYVPFPGKHELLPEIKDDIVAKLEKGTWAECHENELKSVLKGLKKLEEQREVDAVLGLVDVFEAYQSQPRGSAKKECVARIVGRTAELLQEHDVDQFLFIMHKCVASEVKSLRATPAGEMDTERGCALCTITKYLNHILDAEVEGLDEVCSKFNQMII